MPLPRSAAVHVPFACQISSNFRRNSDGNSPEAVPFGFIIWKAAVFPMRTSVVAEGEILLLWAALHNPQKSQDPCIPYISSEPLYVSLRMRTVTYREAAE